MLEDTEMLEVSRELQAWSRRQPPPIARRANMLAMNLALYADRPERDDLNFRQAMVALVANLKATLAKHSTR